MNTQPKPFSTNCIVAYCTANLVHTMAGKPAFYDTANTIYKLEADVNATISTYKDRYQFVNISNCQIMIGTGHELYFVQQLVFCN